MGKMSQLSAAWPPASARSEAVSAVKTLYFTAKTQTQKKPGSKTRNPDTCSTTKQLTELAYTYTRVENSTRQFN